MPRPADDPEPEPRGWNIWLTLMVVAIAFSIAVAVLEYLGVFRDLGIILSLASLALAVGFAINGSSQRTAESIRFDVRSLRRDLAGLGDDLNGLRDMVGRGFAELSRETTRGFAEMNRGAGEIATLLRERLPRPWRRQLSAASVTRRPRFPFRYE